jgi:three-Cys-motif partner protein
MIGPILNAPRISKQDGLPVRVSGPWIEDKYYGLDRYIDIVTKSMRQKFSGGLVFVDLMAGPGVCLDTRSAEETETPGSTFRALKTAFQFDRVVAVDSNPAYVDALQRRADGHPRQATCRFIAGDCNAPETIRAIRLEMNRALTLIFVDLLGTEVRMSTIDALTRAQSVDLLFTWPEMDAVRNTPLMFEQAERWTAFFGSDEWRPIVSAGPNQRLRKLLHLYLKRLESLGYQGTFAPPVKNRKGGRLYRPLFASRNELALKFWSVAQQRHLQQGRLF